MRRIKLALLSGLLCVVALLFISSPAAILASNVAVISVGQISAEPGERVIVPISLESNPGIVGMILNIEYDTSRMQLDSMDAVTQGTALNRLSFIGVNEVTYQQNPFTVLWVGATNDTTTGILLNLEFTVLNSAPMGEAFVRVTAGDGGAVNVDEVPLELTIISGNVIVLSEGEYPPEPTTTPQTPVPTETPHPSTPTTSPTPSPAIPTPSPSPTPHPGDTTHTPTPTPYSLTPTSSPSPQDILPTPTHNLGEQRRPNDITQLQPIETGELPSHQQNSALGHQVFTVPEGEEKTRERMTILHVGSDNVPPEFLVPFRIDSNGTTELVMASMFDDTQGIMQFLGYTGEMYFVGTNEVRFTDVSPDDWFYGAISFVAARGLFRGVGDNIFAPQSTMTRGMFVTVLAVLDGINPSDYNTSPFDDVAIQMWYAPGTVWAYQAGVINSLILTDGNQRLFRPYDNITREEMAVIFASYLTIREVMMNEIAVPLFYDISEANSWAVESIQAMRRYSIIHGVGDNLYNPRGEASRAEVAQIYTNLIRSIVGLN